MKRNHQTLLATAAAVALSLSAGAVLADSQYGYNSAGTGTVTATARVNLTVNVPKLILLRVGSANTTVDTLEWTAGFSIPAVPTPPVNGNDQAVDWDGNAPIVSVTSTPSPAALQASAWTNSSNATVTFSSTGFAPAAGPTLPDVTVASSGTFDHPGADLGTAGSTALTAGTLHSSTWTYTLGGTPGSWAAGSYAAQVVYTATGL